MQNCITSQLGIFQRAATCLLLGLFASATASAQTIELPEAGAETVGAEIYAGRSQRNVPGIT